MEIWKDIIGYEKSYQISNYGNVASLKNNKFKLLKQDEDLKPNGVSYHRVTFCMDGKTTRYKVNRLVANSFIENKENKPQVNHIDNNPSNNYYSNLEWCTGSENALYCRNEGRSKIAVEAAGRKNRTLTFKQAEEIRKIKKETRQTNKEIGKIFGVDRRMIGEIINRKTYNYE